MYFEGNDIGYSNHTYDIWPYTGLTYAGDGSPASTGNVQSITGSGMCSGMQFGYPYKSEADGYVDLFTPNGGSLIFTSQDGNGRIGCYSGISGTYRTITSSVFFSLFQEGGTTRQELMAAYMEFFSGGTGTAEDLSAQFETASVSVVSPSTGILTASICLPGQAGCELGVYDVCGRRVGTLVNGTVASGTHTFAIEAGDLAAGTYFICGTAGDQSVSERTVLLK